MSQLVTGEAVALDLRPARLASRMLAGFLDVLIEVVGLGIVVKLLSSISIFADADFALAAGILVLVTFFVGYPVAFETLWHGKTPGKAALGIRVVRDDGGPIRFRHALTRALLNIVERPGITFGSAAVITSLLSRQGKRLGDILAGTFVLQERVPRQQVVPVAMPPPLAGWAATLDLSRLPDDLALAARGFLVRSAQLRPDARDRLGNDLATAVAGYVTPPPPSGTPAWAFLAAVVAERRRRDAMRGAVAVGGAGRAADAAGTWPPGPTPWQAPPPRPGWPTAEPGSARWAESAPPTGVPPPLGAPPAVGPAPPDPGRPPVPAPPSPQWGPTPVSPPAPPSGVPAAPRSSEPGGPVEPAEPAAAPEDGFAVPG